MVRRLSNITTLRGGTPTSTETAKNFMNYRFNHQTQRDVMYTHMGSTQGWRPMNYAGKPYTAGVGESFDGGMTAPRNDPGATKV
jgi:hypothetical protein